MNRAALSAVVTTYNNAGTLDDCLASLSFCDEIVLLDSGSDDDTVQIAGRHGARVHVEPFKGYGPQKQSAIDKAQHDWILLLDADETLTEAGREAINAELSAPRADGYRLPRREWLFWRWPHPATRSTWQLRLFRKSRGGMNAVPVHAAPEVTGAVLDIDAPFLHYGEPTLAVDTHVFRVANRTGLARGKTPLEVELGLLRRKPPQYLAHAHHWLILHGRYVCQARSPRCGECAVAALCDSAPRQARADPTPTMICDASARPPTT